MKNLIWVYILFLFFCTFTSAAASEKKSVDPRNIMVLVDERYDGDNKKSDMIMVLIDKNENKRTRKVKVYSMDQGDDTMSASFFTYPQDVKDTGFLSYDYDKTTDDDQWLYLPALHKVKRIASDDKTSSFMGSDFSYADMTDREVDDYNYKLMDIISLNNKECFVIESIPKQEKTVHELGYKKSVLFVEKESSMVVRAVHWLDESNRMKFYKVKKMEVINGIATPVEVHMTTKKGGHFDHKTIIFYKNTIYNTNMDKNLFSVRQLEKGAK